MAVKPIPEGSHSVTPTIAVRNADKFIDFVKQVFGATETGRRFMTPDGKIMHAVVKMGDSNIMLSDVMEGWEPTREGLFVYVEDVDEAYSRALKLGAKSTMELADQFWGDRAGAVTDPFGNFWWIAKHIEDVSPEEAERRGKELMRQAQH